MAESSPPSSPPSSALPELLEKIRACRICRDQPLNNNPLPHEPNPVCIASTSAHIAICGQAPGIRVHNTGIPFNDPSGDRLRQWLGTTRDEFYDEQNFSIIPMGFCFPGHDKHRGDLPPRRECRLNWHDQLFAQLPQIKLIIAIGNYAQSYHLQRNPVFKAILQAQEKPQNMTSTVENWRLFLDNNQNTGPAILPLPHPSWRNSSWLKRNPWFEEQLIPVLQTRVRNLMNNGK